MEIIILITAIVVFALKIWILESREDYYMISDSKGLFRKQWKFWGNANEMASLTIPVALLAIFVAWQCVFLLPILWMVFWIVHDFAIGYRLGEGILYTGDTGFDGKMKSTFLRNTWIYLGFKVLWLGLFITMYFM